MQRLMDLLDTPKVHQPLHRKFLPFWCVKRGHCGTGGGCRDGGTSEHFEQIGDGVELECPWAHDTQKERGLQKAAHRFWRNGATSSGKKTTENGRKKAVRFCSEV